MTDRARYGFVVKESIGGEFSIAAEPHGSALPVIQHGTLGFELMDGISYEDAQAVAVYLNEHIVGLSYTP
jgi:hypothetical protein